jgi:hypothetical protein
MLLQGDQLFFFICNARPFSHELRVQQGQSMHRQAQRSHQQLLRSRWVSRQARQRFDQVVTPAPGGDHRIPQLWIRFRDICAIFKTRGESWVLLHNRSKLKWG